MKTAEIRAFLSYFERQGHTRVTSSSLVRTTTHLLFTAGMNQFKDTFGTRTPRLQPGRIESAVRQSWG